MAQARLAPSGGQLNRGVSSPTDRRLTAISMLAGRRAGLNGHLGKLCVAMGAAVENMVLG